MGGGGGNADRTIRQLFILSSKTLMCRPANMQTPNTVLLTLNPASLSLNFTPVLLQNGEKHHQPLLPMHYSTLTEFLRGACLPFVTLTGDIVAGSGINVLLQ